MPSGPSGARSTWTYLLTAVEGGTEVTESVDTERAMPAPIRALMRLAGIRDRPAHLQAGMATTLARLDHAAQRSLSLSKGPEPIDVP